MTKTTNIFYEVAWRRKRSDMVFFSDPFYSLDAAQKYADWRAGNEDETEVEIWMVEKKKQKCGRGREPIDQNGN